MDASKKMKKKKEKKQKKQKQKQKQKQIVKTNVKVNVQSSGGGGGSGGSSIPQYQPMPPQFRDTSGENVKLNNILDTMKKQQEENRNLMNRFTQQEINKDIASSFEDNKEDNMIIENIASNQEELNNNLEELDSAVSGGAEPQNVVGQRLNELKKMKVDELKRLLPNEKPYKNMKKADLIEAVLNMGR